MPTTITDRRVTGNSTAYSCAKNEVDDSILKTIQGLHVELKITQKSYRELVMTNLIVSYPLKITQILLCPLLTNAGGVHLLILCYRYQVALSVIALI